MGNGQRNWAYTLFPSACPNAEKVMKRFAAAECKYLIFGRETCPKTGLQHLQGYFSLREQKTQSYIKKLTHSSIHLEPARRNQIANSFYCSKEGDFWVHTDEGYDPTKNNTKQRNEKYCEAMELARSGDFENIDSELYIKHHDTFKKLWMETTNIKPMYLDTEYGDFFHNHFLWLTGCTGVGKSFRAEMICKVISLFWEDFKKQNPLFDNNFFIDLTYKKNKNKWWDHHQYEDKIICEEMCPDSAKFMADKIKIWCDQYAFPVEVKQGSFKAIRPKFIIFTSNFTIRECFPDPRDYQPLERRIKEIVVTDKSQKIRWPNLNLLNREWKVYSKCEALYKNVARRMYLEQFKAIDWDWEPLEPGNRPTVFNMIDQRGLNRAAEKELHDATEGKNLVSSDDIIEVSDSASPVLLPSLSDVFAESSPLIDNSIGGIIDREILGSPSTSDDEFLGILADLVKGNEKAEKKLNAYEEMKKAQQKEAVEHGPKIFRYEPPQKRKGKELNCCF